MREEKMQIKHNNYNETGRNIPVDLFTAQYPPTKIMWYKHKQTAHTTVVPPNEPKHHKMNFLGRYLPFLPKINMFGPWHQNFPCGVLSKHKCSGRYSRRHGKHHHTTKPNTAAAGHTQKHAETEKRMYILSLFFKIERYNTHIIVCMCKNTSWFSLYSLKWKDILCI